MPPVIAQRYHLLELLGRGGMGAVWRARDETLHREVAIKEVTLPPGLDDGQRAHLDVKPANVLLPSDRAVLTDFGIASVAGDETLTQAGVVLGSPAYLAPEQARQSVATPASDLWSLGATLYAAVEGRPPYQRPDVWGVMAAVLSDEPDPPRLAGPLRPVLDGLLRKDPAQRMTPDEAARLLIEITHGPEEAVWTPPSSARNLTLPPLPAPETVATPPQPPARSKGPRWPILIPAAVLVAALAVARLRVFSFNGYVYLATMISTAGLWKATVPYFDRFLTTFRKP